MSNDSETTADTAPDDEVLRVARDVTERRQGLMERLAKAERCDAKNDAASSWMSAEATSLYERAEALAEQRGCVIENDCWIECVDAAIEEVARVTPPA